jgi:hypothetical protein
MSDDMIRYELPRGLIVHAQGLGEVERVGDALYFADGSMVRLDSLEPRAKGRFMGPGLLAVGIGPEVSIDQLEAGWDSVGQVRVASVGKGESAPHGVGIIFLDGTWVERGASVDNVEFLFQGPGAIVMARAKPEPGPPAKAEGRGTPPGVVSPVRPRPRPTLAGTRRLEGARV